MTNTEVVITAFPKIGTPKSSEISELLVTKIRQFFKGKALRNEPMRRHTTFRIGGPADLFLEPYDREDLVNLLRFFHEHQLSYLVIGNGSNLLVSDRGVRGAVIRVGRRLGFIRVQDEAVDVGAGTSLVRLCQTSLRAHLAGLEFLVGIPAAVGGAIMVNAGTEDGSIGDVVEELEVIDRIGNLKTLGRRELQFGYRNSNLKPLGYTIIGAKLCLRKDKRDEIAKRIEKIKEKRKKTQPISLPSAGCIFRNPPGVQAGRLLELVGGKGLAVGNAAVSRKHANFIVNRGGAKASDVVKLMQELQERVESRFGVKLVPEVELVGDWD